jgi:Flp pilus assembly protein TadG
MNNKSRRSRRNTGAASIEAAIAIPVLLMITVGFFEYGWQIHNSHMLHNAARRGARSAASHENSSAEVEAAVVSALQNSISIEAADVNVQMVKLKCNGTEAYTINSLSETENGEPIRVVVTVQNSHLSGLFNLFLGEDEFLTASATVRRNR